MSNERDDELDDQHGEREDFQQALRVLRRIVAAREHKTRIQARYYRQAERLLKRRGYLIETAKDSLPPHETP